MIMADTRRLLAVAELDPLSDLPGPSPGDTGVGGHALDRVLGTMTGERFLDRYWGRDCYHDTGEPDRFHHLLPWAELNRLLDGHRAWPLRMQVARANKSLPPSSYVEPIPGRGVGREPALRVSSTKLHARLREGATLVFGSVDEAVPAVRDLAEALEHDLRAEVFVNLYASWGEVGAFDPHWDDHDGLILQIYGRKEWQLFGVGRPVPLPGDEPLNECPATPWRQFELREGEALYVPRGHWHAVRPVGGTTVHLTIGFRRPVVEDFLKWAVERQRRLPEARHDLPLSGWDDETASRLSVLREEIGALLTEDGLRRYVAERDGRAQARPRHSLPYAASGQDGDCPPDAVVVLASPRPVALREDGGRCVLVSAGKRYDFDAVCAPLVRRLLARTPWRVDELVRAVSGEGGPSAGEGRELVAELLRHGLLRLDLAPEPLPPGAPDRKDR
ncbi:cupin [Sphaerisporangium album]|uniref:Cupin n=2 Tax=Sphaerisporangium album TaxID=509200 RepID=A0A367FIQ8_9ACTN|nr:cupin [Sphaerisporangium album]